MKIEFDKADLARVKIMLAGVKNGAPRVMTRAINKTLTGVRSTAKKEIAKHYSLTQKRIDKDFTTNKANFNKISGGVIAKGKPIGLLSFTGTKKTKKGVRVRVLREKKSTVIKSAFVTRAGFAGARTGEKPLGVFRRASKKRYPIHRLTGPRIEDEFGKDRTMNAVMSYAGGRIKTTTNQELNFELSKL